MIHIPSEDIKQPQLHADTLGFTFVWNGHFFRGIFPQSVEYAKGYFESGFIDEVVERGLFPKTWVSEFENEQFGMIIEHEIISPVLYATEWNSSMLKDAALMVLDIAEIGWKYGYNMVDCHKLNVMFKNNQPVYVDLGSFVPREKGSTGWKPYKNFLESYTFILDMWTHGCPQVAKRMMSPGVTLQSKDYWAWKSPLYRLFPVLLRAKLNTQKILNTMAILGTVKGGRQKVLKSLVNIIKPGVSQRLCALRKCVERERVVTSSCERELCIDTQIIQPTKSMTVINVNKSSLLDTLHRCLSGNMISLNENDAISNDEYLKRKTITSVSYNLLNGSVLVRGKFPETRLQSDVVFAFCEEVDHGKFALHNCLVYLEQCMMYSITGVLYILLPKPNLALVDLVCKKWSKISISDDETLIAVKKTY